MLDIKKNNTDLYNTLLVLSRNVHFYKEIKLKDTFETRIYLMFMHFSIILLIFKFNQIKFPQNEYDNLFNCIENNLRELGYGDVAVNKKMKDLNKILYDILLKISKKNENFKINELLVLKYFDELNDLNSKKYKLFDHYFGNFYNFCFELTPKNMIQDALKFRI